MLGTDFPYRQFFPDDARIAQIDVRVEALGNRCALDVGVVGDGERHPGRAAAAQREGGLAASSMARSLTIARLAPISMLWRRAGRVRELSIRST